MIDRPQTEVGRRRFRWKLVIYGSFGVGIVTMVVASALGHDLVGAVAYFVGVAVGSLACVYACFLGDVTIGDERHDAIERRASHYTVMGLAYVGIAVFPTLIVLEAAGEFQLGPPLEFALYGLSGLFLLWGGVYTVLRWRS